MTNNTWSQVSIADLADIWIGGTPSRNKPEYWDIQKSTQNIWVSIRDLSGLKDKYISDSSEYITDEGVKKSNVKLISNNTVLMSFKLSIGKVAITKKPLYTNEAIASFNIKNKNKLDPIYLYYVLPIINYDTDVAIKGNTLNKAKLNTSLLPLPPLNVQKKIGDILSSIDVSIQKTDQIIQKTEVLKQGLMSELLMRGIGHKKFKKTKIGDIPESWMVVKLGDLANVERGRFSVRPRNDPRFYGGDIPFIQTGDVVSSNGKIKSYSQTLNKEGLRVSKLFKKGTIVLTIAANIGDTGILEFDACFPDSLVGITPGEQLDTIYLEYFLRFRKDYLNSIATQSAQKNINLAKLNPMLIAVPSMQEQKQIGNILSSIDKKISIEQREKERLLCLKRGFIEDIFSQKVQIN